jgi:flagellar hook assembly protein FlgD
VEPYHVKIAVYDVLGRQVNVITDDAKSPGIYNATWDVRAAAGTYFIKCSAGSYTSVKRMMIMR